MTARIRSSEVEEMQAAARLQHSPDRAQRTFFLAAFEVVEHERREHAIERRVRIVQRVGEAALEGDIDSRLLCLPLGSRERPRVRIESDDLDLREQPLRENDEAPCSTPDIKYPLARLEIAAEWSYRQHHASEIRIHFSDG